MVLRKFDRNVTGLCFPHDSKIDRLRRKTTMFKVDRKELHCAAIICRCFFVSWSQCVQALPRISNKTLSFYKTPVRILFG